jgi:hypothetical protein
MRGPFGLRLIFAKLRKITENLLYVISPKITENFSCVVSLKTKENYGLLAASVASPLATPQ